ncbi:MAG: tRNA (guanosine(46)-N7)-methyltransferase TrmB [Bacilli bacterium]|nr:tRNA (guanosine(46)-N7)-methyltransferase TrmB [Bacilli bacterium]
MRLRKIKNAKEKLLEFPNLVIQNPEDYIDKWSEIFKNSNEIHLEIGMGKGKFITTNAMLNPDKNYIGLEISDSMVLKAAREISQKEIKNLKLINYDAANLREIFKQKSISKIYLNFSDPWPKARHAKRRLTSDEFLIQYLDILTDDGIIEMKTDNRNLFEYSLMKLNEFKFKFEEVNLNLHDIENNEIITTEYEEKFKMLKNIIYYIKVKK